MIKYIFVTDDMISGTGKGVLAAALGCLFRARGLNVANQRFDPYINIDPGTISPIHCGEVFITDDGAETDACIGHYERFTGESFKGSSNVTAGAIYWSVINKERTGDYLGHPVRVVPHITDEIKKRIYGIGKNNTDIVIIEIGGEADKMECLPFLEAAAQLKFEVGEENAMYIHGVTLSNKSDGQPKEVYIGWDKSEFLSRSLKPDAVLLRTDEPISSEALVKISLCNDMASEQVICVDETDLSLEIPLILEKAGLGLLAVKKLGLADFKPNLTAWKQTAEKYRKCTNEVRIALVGKYMSAQNAYLSVSEALCSGGIAEGVRTVIDWVDSELLTDGKAHELLGAADGIIVPDAHGTDGTDGMIAAAKYARVFDVPYFGIGLGMHMAAVELARNVLGLKGASSVEIDSTTPYPVITDLREGACIGRHQCKITRNTKVFHAYERELFCERFRHRYQISSAYRHKFEEGGLYFVGTSQDGDMCTAIEIPEKSWYIGVQYRPEFISAPTKPHPLFKAFAEAAALHASQKT